MVKGRSAPGPERPGYSHCGAGISVSAAKYLQIIGNIIARSGEWNFHSGPNNTAIRVAATGAQIRNNVINGAAGAGIQIGGGADGIEVTGNVVRNASN